MNSHLSGRKRDHGDGYWYLASYPKSGNTWCRAFIAQVQRLTNSSDIQKPLNLNEDLNTGIIVSSRHWIDDQLGINSCDLSVQETDRLRSKAGKSMIIYADSDRYHKVHDSFMSPDSNGFPVVCTEGCNGVVYITRNPEDIVVSLSHFYSWSIDECVQSLLDPNAALLSDVNHGSNQVRQHLGRWDQHVRSWISQDTLPILLIRYEDMINKPLKTFTSIASFLHLEDNSTIVRLAIDATSINRMKELEQRLRRFREKPDSCKTFFRSGKIGEGAEQMDLSQRLMLYTKFADTMDLLGYNSPLPNAH
jgi:hypothetical protein